MEFVFGLSQEIWVSRLAVFRWLNADYTETVVGRLNKRFEYFVLRVIRVC